MSSPWKIKAGTRTINSQPICRATTSKEQIDDQHSAQLIHLCVQHLQCVDGFLKNNAIVNVQTGVYKNGSLCNTDVQPSLIAATLHYQLQCFPAVYPGVDKLGELSAGRELFQKKKGLS
jgi:hypothetical protein